MIKTIIHGCVRKKGSSDCGDSLKEYEQEILDVWMSSPLGHLSPCNREWHDACMILDPIKRKEELLRVGHVIITNNRGSRRG